MLASTSYQAPELTEYGSMESITQYSNDKCGTTTDSYTGQTSLTGSFYDCTQN